MTDDKTNKARGVILSALMILSVVALAGAAPVAGQQTVEISLEDVEASPGDTVSVTLSAQADNVAGYGANFTFDPSVVQVQSVEGADFNAPTANIDNENGSVFFTQSQSSGVDNPDLAVINLQVVGNAGNSTPLTFVQSDTSLNDEQANDIPIDNYNNGSVTVPETASVTFNAQKTFGEMVTVDQAFLPDGGFVAIHEVTDGQPGDIIGVSSQLPSGTSGPVDVQLDSPISESQSLIAMAHKANNSDLGAPYLDNDGNPITDSASITFINADETLQSGNTYWGGQKLFRDAGVDSGETMELREATADGNAGDLVRQVPDSNNDGAVVIDTSGLDGAYVLEDSDNNIVASFEVVPQDLTVSWASDSVQNAGDATSVDLQFDSNRGTYQVELTAANLSAEDLHSIFGGTMTDDSVILSGVTSDGVVTADFTGIAADSYDITATVTDTTAQSSDSIQVNSPGDITASFAEPVVEEDRGDVLSYTINLQNTDTAAIDVGSADVNYAVDLTITDGDDDGQVTVLVDTLHAGTVGDEGQVYSTADEDDSVTANRTTAQLNNPLSTGDYDLSVSVGGEEKAVGSFFLRQRSTDAITIWTAPGNKNIDELADLESGLTQTTEVTMGDYFIAQVEASGLYAYLSSVGDFGENGLSLKTVEQNPGVNQEPRTFTVGDGDPGMIITDPANDQFYYIIQEPVNPDDAGSQWTTTFAISDANPYVAADTSESVSSTWTLEGRTGTIDTNVDEMLMISATENATITGSSSLAPGTELTVQVRSQDNTEPFLERVFPTVSEDGSWEATFDLSELPDGTPLKITLKKGGETLATVDAEIGAPPTPTEVETPTPRVVTVQQPSPTPKVVEETRIVEETRVVEQTRTVIQERTVIVTKTTGQPGFGIAVAVVALLAAALLAVRRRD